MRALKIYLRKGDANDATAYYVETVAEAFRRVGYQVISTDNVKTICGDDTVLVITMKAFLLVWMRKISLLSISELFKFSKQTKAANRSKLDIYMWFQGIVPEEAMMQFAGHWSRKFRYHIWSLVEPFVLNSSKYLLFVSHAMVKHYSHKYGFKGTNYYVMPCFNLQLNKTFFEAPNKYEIPTFVYAGTLSAWQCIDQTLKLCRAIQNAMPDSKFTILTTSIEQGKEMASRIGLINTEVKYVPSTEVGKELSRHKYGFLLREDTAVNNVATPTKLNSYMASGVLPIYSDVIGDFSSELSDIKYLIKVENINQTEDIVSRILEIETNKIQASDVLAEFEKIFAKYYSREYHIKCLENIINHTTN